MKKHICGVFVFLFFSCQFIPLPEGYLVVYDTNGADSGTVPSELVYYNKGDSIVVADKPGDLSKAGYLFSRWNSTADASGIDYWEGESLTMGTEHIVLYAVWVEPITTDDLGIQMKPVISSSDIPLNVTLQDGTKNVIFNQGFQVSEAEITHAQFIKFLNSRNVVSDGSYKEIELIDMDDSDRAIKHNGTSFYFKKSSNAETEDTPVMEITWYGAVEFCNWLSEQEGKDPVYDRTDWSWDISLNGYRLPGEDEWEYAGEGGAAPGSSSDFIYAGSNQVDEVAWYIGNSETKTHPVKEKFPNAFGLYDMSGNVYEWCLDWYSNYSGDFGSENTASGSYRIVRGGSWFVDETYCSVSFRYGSSPDNSDNDIGFRIVSSLP